MDITIKQNKSTFSVIKQLHKKDLDFKIIQLRCVARALVSSEFIFQSRIPYMQNIFKDNLNLNFERKVIKNYLQNSLWPTIIYKIFRLTLVFMQSGALWEKFNFCFSRVFVSINKFFNLAGRLIARLLLFYEVFKTF